MAAFRPVSCLTASSVSKAIPRVAIDQLMRAFPDDPTLLYFPACENVKEFFADAYQEDNWHPKPEIIDFVMQMFARTYCETSA
jgi:hypothetical protein